VSWITRKTLEALDNAARAEALAELRAGIDARLAGKPWDDFWKETSVIVAELKKAGHDIWSWDWDGKQSHLWGWDYMRPDTAGKLQIEFTFARSCRTFWRDEGWRLGTSGDLE
jgi:hypothetical protein